VSAGAKLQYPLRVSRGSLFSVFAVAALLAGTEACSLVLDTSADQCSSNADCAKKGAAFAGSVCGPERTCLIKCSSNKACTATAGEPSICVKASGFCAKLKSPDCQTIYQEPGAIDDDGAVVLGTLFPMTGVNAAGNLPRVSAAELARRHIHRASSGLPGINGGPARPLVLLACDDAQDALRAARHLANDLRVPGIVGPPFSGVTTSVAKEVTIPAGTLLISPSATSPTLTALADNGLVWRTAPSDVLQAEAMVQLVSRLEGDVRLALSLKPADKIRIAVAHKGDAYGTGLASVLSKSLRWNAGADAAANMEFYKQLDYGDPQKSAAADQAASYKRTVDALLAFKPHIQITIGTAEAVTEIFARVEQGLALGDLRPTHLLSDGLRTPELLNQIGANDSLRKRVLGTVPGVPGPNFSAFKIAFDGAFPGTSADSYAAGAYDATLLLGFAIAAAGDKQPLTGALLDEGLKKTIPGAGRARVNADVNDINNGFAGMAGAGIDFAGASGPLDFDPATGEAKADIQIWCLKPVAGKPPAFGASGLVFAAQTGLLDGTFSCP
jgi:branched-chain amino acid transport system substrate-binding protein